MTVLFHKNQSRVVHPWLSADLGDPVLGSAFQARVFISNPTIRGLVRSFASAGKLVRYCTALPGPNESPCSALSACRHWADCSRS